MSQLFRKQVDNMMDAYVGWHEACRLVNDAYSSWSNDRAARQSRFLAVHGGTRRGGAGGRGLRRHGPARRAPRHERPRSRRTAWGATVGSPVARAPGAASPTRPVLPGASGRRHAFAGSFLGRRESWRAAGRDARALYKHGIVADLLVGTDRACGGRAPRATLDAAI
jgi:hypothetical protein